MSAEAIATPDVGDIVGEGRFELGRKLGEGGMSNVFVARDRFLDRDVALKLLIPRYLGRPEREKRFLNEAEYLRRVQDHAHLTRIIDSGRLRDLHQWPWLSTEIMSGKTLDWLKLHRSLDIHQTLEVARQLAEALRACHEAGVVHRDLTPNNVFVLDDGSVKLFDFSHAADLRGPKLAVGAPERLTRVWEAPGTVGYIAPEQAANAAPDACMDAYSYGVLLYEVVSRSHPFKRYSDRDEFIQAQVEGTLETPWLQAWAYDAPEELAELVSDCMQRDGSKRPTMSEVLERLDGIIAMMRQGDGDDDATAVMGPVVHAEVKASEDVTAAMDAPAMTAGRRPSPPNADPATIGAWVPLDPGISFEQAVAEDRRVYRQIARATREPAPAMQEERTEFVPVVPAAREQAPAVAPAPREQAPKVQEERTEVVPVAPASPVAEPPRVPGERTEVMPVAPAAPEQESAAAEPELAFARPPQLREAAAVSSVWGEANSAGPSEVRQLDGDASGGIDPENSSATAAAELGDEDEPAPIGPSRRRIVGLLVGLGLVVMLLSWVAYTVLLSTEADPEKKIDGDRDQPAAGSHDLDVAPDPDRPPHGETGATDSDAVGETGGMEIVPEVEPVELDPQPKPKNGKPRNGKPKNGKPTNGKNENGKPTNGKDPAEDTTSREPETADPSPECAGIEDEARAALNDRKWRRVANLTARKACWTSNTERIRLRVEALFGLGDWSTCVSTGEGSKDAKVRSFVDKCKTAESLSQLETP